MLDQAYQLRRLALERAPAIAPAVDLPPTIVVAGGKGGVGTTTVAVNLAAALAQGGHRAVLVDAAPNADSAQLLGIEVGRGRSLDDVLSGNCSAGDALCAGPAGIQLLAGEGGAERTRSRSGKPQPRLADALRALTDQADVLVVDAGSGTNALVGPLWGRSALVLVVTTPDDVAVVDSYRAIKHSLPDDEIDVRVLVNQCSDAATATDVQSRLAAACRRFLGRSIGRAPLLPRHIAPAGAATPLAWELHATPFARNVHQLGRFAADVVSQSERARCDAEEFSTC